MTSSKIIGTGSYLPEKVLTNSDLEGLVDTSNDWIVSRTGIEQRRIAENESTSEMGTKAAQCALEKAGLSIDDIDFIFVATCTPDYQALSTACIIQNALGAPHVPALDIQATCSGYLYGIFLANSLVKSGTFNNILVIASEKLSSITNYQDRSTCILFGDGAAACVVSSANQAGLKIRNLLLGANGKFATSGFVPAGGCKTPASIDTVNKGLHYIQMTGNEIFKLAVRKMEESCKKSLEACGLQVSDVNWLVPHQANLRIIEALAKRFGFPQDKLCITIRKYGNTSAASIGIALDELMRNKNIQPSQNLLLTSVGFGLTWASGVLTYQNPL
ncbi:MAG: 3-oxoacyl-[acyl-carrier-protein] synthase 3 [Chlamydiae bacterium]|nr:3-oxoacyl-[acyl-carrier-protein] synthase 3 [Chlamydiota bacterium]